MFRRDGDTMEPDPVFGANVNELRYFINKNGQIRSMDYPDKPFNYRATNQQRFNDARQEAMEECVRLAIESRLRLLGVERMWPPGFIGPRTPANVPILSPPQEVLCDKKSVYVVINDNSQDLGILSHAQSQGDLGINGGSIVNFVKEIVGDKKYPNIYEDGATILAEDFPGVIVMNTGQLLYSHKHDKVLTLRSWSNLPRKSKMHNPPNIDEIENRIQGHRTPEEHIKTTLTHVVLNEDIVPADAQIYVVAIGSGAWSLLNVLNENFPKYGSRMTAMALVDHLYHDMQISDQALRAFLHQRTREWRYSTLTSDPCECVHLPVGYIVQDDVPCNEPKSDTAREYVHGAEGIPTRDDAGDTLLTSQAMSSLSIQTNPPSSSGGVSIQHAHPSSSQEDDSPSLVVDDESSVLCPAFAGGDFIPGETVFINKSVQRAIVAFFNAVAGAPDNYRNPCFEAIGDISQPAPNRPLELASDHLDAVQ